MEELRTVIENQKNEIEKVTGENIAYRDELAELKVLL